MLRKNKYLQGPLTKQHSESTNNDIVQEEVVGSYQRRLTDYDNAKVGAEIKGAIPGFMRNKDNYITVEIKTHLILPGE